MVSSSRLGCVGWRLLLCVEMPTGPNAGGVTLALAAATITYSFCASATMFLTPFAAAFPVLFSPGPGGSRVFDPGCCATRGKGAGGTCVLEHSGFSTSAPRLDPFPPLDLDAGRTQLSLQVSNAISCFARYPNRRPARLISADDGSMDVHQIWLHWGRRMNFSRQQQLQCITEPFPVRAEGVSCSAATKRGSQWPSRCAVFLGATVRIDNLLSLAPTVTRMRVSLVPPLWIPVGVAVVSVSTADGCDAHTEDDIDEGPVAHAADRNTEAQDITATNIKAEPVDCDSDPPPDDAATAAPRIAPDVKLERDSVPKDFPDLQDMESEPDSFPPTIPAPRLIASRSSRNPGVLFWPVPSLLDLPSLPPQEPSPGLSPSQTPSPPLTPPAKGDANFDSGA